MGKFCVRCGVEEPALIIDGLCLSCLVAEGRAVKPPEAVEVITCPSCGSIQSGNRWLGGVGLEDFLRDLILSKCEFHRDFKLRSLDVRVGDGKVTAFFKGFLRNAEVSAEFQVSLSMKRSLCPQCSKVKSGYYEAVIQIRSFSEPFDDVLRGKLVDTLLRSSNTSRYITEIEPVREGLNVKVLSQGVARKLASDLISMYGGVVSESWKVVGMSSSGKNISRLTISLRLLGLSPGDLVLHGGSPALVEEIRRNFVKVRMIDSGNVVKLHVDDLSGGDLKLVRRDEYEVLDGRVMEVLDGKVLVRGLRGSATYELPLSEGLVPGSNVKLLIYKDRIYLAHVEK